MPFFRDTNAILAKPKQPIEYIVVSDTNSRVLLSTENRYEAQKLATKIRAAGGSVTVFRSTKL